MISRGDKYESFDHTASIRRIQSRGVDVNTFPPPEKPANISNANSIKRRRIRMRRNSVRIGPLFLTNLVSNSVEIVAGPRRGKTRGMRGRKSREERSPHNRVISSLGTRWIPIHGHALNAVFLLGKIAGWPSESRLDRAKFFLLLRSRSWKYAKPYKRNFSNLRFLIFENCIYTRVLMYIREDSNSRLCFHQLLCFFWFLRSMF